jgi:hypothetical protein
MIQKIVITTLLTIALQADSCWTSAELASFAQDEFSDMARISIKDAKTCEPIKNARFTFLGQKFEGDDKGIVALPLPPEELDAEVEALIEANGYITSKEKVMVTFGSYWNNLFLMSKELPLNSARFVLSWDKKPADLDLHLVATKYHISFRKMKNYKQSAFLDRDAMHGYGAETITLNALEPSETYKVLVHRYSKDASIDTKTQVRIYLNNKLDNVVRLPASDESCFEVATIKNKKISYETRVSSECR